MLHRRQDQTSNAETRYFAVMVPEGVFGLAFISRSVVSTWDADSWSEIFFVAWITSQQRGRTWTSTLEDAWEFLYEAFGSTVQFREITQTRYRQILSKLRPAPRADFITKGGVFTLPGGTTVRIVKRDVTPSAFPPARPSRGIDRPALPMPRSIPSAPPSLLSPPKAKRVVRQRTIEPPPPPPSMPLPPPPPSMPLPPPPPPPSMPLPPPPPPPSTMPLPHVPFPFDIDSLPQTRKLERVRLPRKRRRR